MFNTGVAIDDHGEVMVKGGSTFRDDVDTHFTGGLQNLLTLIPPWLIITLNAFCTKGFGASNTAARIAKTVDRRFEIAVSSIQYESGRVEARSY